MQDINKTERAFDPECIDTTWVCVCRNIKRDVKRQVWCTYVRTREWYQYAPDQMRILSCIYHMINKRKYASFWRIKRYWATTFWYESKIPENTADQRRWQSSSRVHTLTLTHWPVWSINTTVQWLPTSLIIYTSMLYHLSILPCVHPGILWCPSMSTWWNRATFVVISALFAGV